MKRKTTAGQTGVTLPIFVEDSSSTTGAGLAGLVYNSAGLVAEYRRQGASSWTAITLAAGTLGTWSSGGFVADGSLDGAYELGLPDAALASGAQWVAVRLRGATNMLAVLIEVELDAVNYQDADGLGLSRLDAAIGSRLPAAGYTAPDNASAVAAAASAASADAKLSAARLTTLDRYATMIVDVAVDGSYEFTAAALVNAPTGGGGGGSLTVEQAAQLESAYNKTLLLGTGEAPTVVTSVNAAGKITLYQGVDYLASLGRSIDLVDADGSTLPAAGSALRLQARHPGRADAFEVDGTVVDPLDGSLIARFDVARAETSGLQPDGRYAYYVYEVIGVGELRRLDITGTLDLRRGLAEAA